MAVVVGSFSCQFLDGTQQIYAATRMTIFKGVNLQWFPVGTGYAASDRWRFTLFGDDLIATDFTDPVQMAHGPNGAFGPLAGNPPRARLVEAANNFVFLMNTEFASNQWWCCGIGADTLWTPDIATQAANNTLVETEGPITAAKKLGSTIVGYKKKSMYIGQYQGPPTIWGFFLVSNAAGAPCQEAVVDLGDIHVFPGVADFYSYDGSAPKPLNMPSSVREFFFEFSLDASRADRIIGRWDRKLEVVTWHYPSKSAVPPGTLDTEIKWHVPTNKWTLMRRIVEYVMLPEMPTSPGITYDQFGSFFNAYGDDIQVTYEDTLFAGSQTYEQAIFLPGGRLFILNGVPGPTSFLTGDIGSEDVFTYIRRLKPKFAQRPAEMPTLTEFYKTNLGDATVEGETKTLFGQDWFNLRRRARFHRYLYEATGDYEIIGIEPDVVFGGKR